MTGDGDVPMDSMTTLEYEIPAAHPAYVAELDPIVIQDPDHFQKFACVHNESMPILWCCF